MLGYKELPFEVKQTGEVYYDLLKSGRIKIDPSKKIKVACHAPGPVQHHKKGRGSREIQIYCECNL